MRRDPAGLQLGCFLDQLDQHTANCLRMKEGDLVPAGSRARLVIDDLEPSRLQFLEGRSDVRDSICDVVEPGTSALDEASNAA